MTLPQRKVAVNTLTGELLRQTRVAANLKQRHVAERTGYGIPTLSRIEEGKIRIALYEVITLCKAVGVSLDAFVLGLQQLVLDTELHGHVVHDGRDNNPLPTAIRSRAVAIAKAFPRRETPPPEHPPT